MAEEIIKARVWTKVDTLENWNNNPLLLGPGEMALVTTPSGIPLNMKWGDKTQRKRFSDLPFAISYDQGQFVAIDGPGALPTPDSEVGYSLVGPGTYTYPGQADVVAPDGRLSQLVYADGEWSLIDMGPIPQAINKILYWEPGSYILGDQRIHKGQIWSVVVPSTTDEPGGGSSWGPDLDILQQSDLRYSYSPVWEQGSIVGTTGEDTDSSNPVYPNRVRTQGFLESDGEIYVATQAGQEIIVYYYDDNGDFISNTGFQQSPLSLQYQGLFRVAIRKPNPNEPLVPSENTAKLLSGNKFITREEVEEDYAKKSDVIMTYSPVWEQGTISATTGNNYPDTWETHLVRVRTANFMESNGRVDIITEDGQQVSVYLYDENENYISTTDFRNSPFDFNHVGKFKVVVRNQDSSAPINPSEVLVDIPDRDIYVRVEDFDVSDFVKQSEIKVVYNPVWEQGTVNESTGEDYPDTTPNHSRRVRTSNFMVVEDEDIIVTSQQEQRVGLYLYDSNGNFISSTGLIETPYTVHHNGLFRAVARKIDGSEAFDPSEVLVELDGRDIYVRRDEIDSIDPVFKRFSPPAISNAPLGDTIGYSFADKEILFEEILDGYPASWTSQVIGQSYSGLQDVKAYTIAPERYTVTIAITCHVHGNEKYNSTGFFALLSLLSDPNLEHEFMLWMVNNVRWIVVPFVSPEGYIRNNRYTNNVNLNRNMDYDWAEVVDGLKGSAPMSMVENQNIQNFFMPIRNEIDFHLDTHDIPSQAGISYWVWQNKDFVWIKEQDYVETYLVNLNETTKRSTPYEAVGGSYTQYFTEVLGIPSITPEHSTLWWANLGLPIGAQIAKATEQTAAFLCMFANMHKQMRGHPFYNKLVDRSFLSEQFGIDTWTKSEFYASARSVDGWVETDEYNGVMSYTLEPSSYNKTILIYAGVTFDNRSSSLVVKSVMEELTIPNERLPIYLQLLKKSRIIVVPILNENPEFEPEEQLSTLVDGFQTRYSADYTLIVRGVTNDSEVMPISARSIDASNLTRWTREHISDTSVGAEGIENYLTGRYSTIVLNNHIAESSRYAHGTVKWIESVINDIASFNKE